MALVNGQIPISSLTTISGTSERVRSDLAAQTNALRLAFQARFNKPLNITDAYRSLSEQESIFFTRYTTNYSSSAKIDKRYYKGKNYWRKPGYSSAATPGQSNHGLGQAIDFGSNVAVLGSLEHTWMVQNGPRYGYSWPKLFQKAPYLEPWHFEAVFVPASSYSSSNPTPDPTPEPVHTISIDEVDMLIEVFYKHYFNRTPSNEDIIFWATTADSNNWGASALNTAFLNAKAEPGTVRVYYQRLLRRDPTDADIQFWANGTRTVQQVIDGIKASTEYKG